MFTSFDGRIGIDRAVDVFAVGTKISHSFDISASPPIFAIALGIFQETDLEDPMGKTKQQDNPFIEPSQQHTVVDMKGEILCAFALNKCTVKLTAGFLADVMVLNDIIEQAAGRQSQTPEQGGNVAFLLLRSFLTSSLLSLQFLLVSSITCRQNVYTLFKRVMSILPFDVHYDLRSFVCTTSLLHSDTSLRRFLACAPFYVRPCVRFCL